MFKRLKKKHDDIIEFIIDNDVLLDTIPRPEPAGHLLPDWYKKLPKTHTDTVPFERTIKQCAPFVDALSAGYILKVPQRGDFVFSKDEPVRVGWAGYIEYNHGPVFSNHGPGQVEGSGWGTPLKILNPWIIKTPPGVSCLFVNPLNRDLKLPFEIVSGIVDTDSYPHPVNIPVIQTVDEWTGVINGGTPYVQVIPFRRTKLKPVFRAMTEEDDKTDSKLYAFLGVHDGAYRRFLRHK